MHIFIKHSKYQIQEQSRSRKLMETEFTKTGGPCPKSKRPVTAEVREQQAWK